MVDIQRLKTELIEYFQTKLGDQTAELKLVDESQLSLLEAEISKTEFTLSLLEDGKTEFNGETIILSDKKIELLYNEYVRQ